MLEKLADRVAKEKHEITRQWEDTPYLTRWVLWGERNAAVPRRNLYLHRFTRSDSDTYHDHPWPFTSIILAGGYWEHTPTGPGGLTDRKRWYGPGRILRRPAQWKHWVEVPAGREVWTLLLVGRKVRSWGFWCARATALVYRPWRAHYAMLMQTGDGCGE